MCRKKSVFPTKLKIKAEAGEYGSAVTLSYSSAASQQQVTVLANRNWEQTSVEGGITWASLDAENGGYGKTYLNVSVQKNETGSERSGYLQLRTKNERKEARIYVEQELGEAIYNVTFICRECSEQGVPSTYLTADTLSYKINDGNWSYVYGTKTGFTISVKVGDIVYYRATKDGYCNIDTYDTIIGNVDHIICFREKIANEYFEITDVIYISNKTGSPEHRTIENRWMDEDTVWDSNNPKRAALVSLHKDNNNYYPQDPDIYFLTNMPPSYLGCELTYISGGTDWIREDYMAIGETLDDVWYDFLEYHGIVDGYSAFSLTICTSSAVIGANPDIVRAATLSFYEAEGNLVGEIPIVVETSARDYLRLYSGQTIASGRSNELSAYTRSAASGYSNVWVECSKRLHFGQINDNLEYSTLKFYNEDASELLWDPSAPQTTPQHIGVILPTVISGSNGVLQFHSDTNNRYPFKVWSPTNTSLSVGRNYGVCLKTAWYTGLDVNWIDHGEIYINQARNYIYYTNYEFDTDDEWCSGFSLSYRDDISDTTLTVPSSAISYNSLTEQAIQTLVSIKCHHYSSNGVINNPNYHISEFTLGSGDKVDMPNGGELLISYPTWASLANGSGPYDYRPQEGIPFTLNVQKNQTSASTGYSRSSGVTITLNNVTLKDGGVSAKTVTLTQEWSRKVNYAAQVITVDGEPSEEPDVAHVYPEKGGSITVVLSAANGTVISVPGCYDSPDILNYVEITVGSKTLTRNDYSYTVSADGSFNVVYHDLNYGDFESEGRLDFMVTAPTGYVGGPIEIVYDNFYSPD